MRRALFAAIGQTASAGQQLRDVIGHLAARGPSACTVRVCGRSVEKFGPMRAVIYT